MKKDIGLILIGAFLMLIIVGYIWLHFRVKGLENWVNNIIVNSQRQQQAQQIQQPQPTK